MGEDGQKLRDLEKARDTLANGIEQVRAVYVLPIETELHLEDALSEVDSRLTLAWEAAEDVSS